MPDPSSVYREAPFAVVSLPGPETATYQLIWGHGWGQSSDALLPLAESLRAYAPSLLIDFPGFGKSALPGEVWGTAEYADQVANWIQSFSARRTIWIGHSFGGRIGLQLAARHPELLSGMVLVASAGLPRTRTLTKRLQMMARTALFNTAKRVLGDGPAADRLRQRMGSADYRSAGALRPIVARVIREDLSEVARQVECPTLLVYGENDTETPPEIGERLQRFIPNSRLVRLESFGHLTVLTEGRHQVASRIHQFLSTLPS
jgi:pimeloyl-ACP methyl ester carboxylesterase